MTKRDYERYEELYDRCAELEDMITDVKHIMTYGIVQSDPDRLASYEEELRILKSDLNWSEQELDRLAAAIERIERADFERMSALIDCLVQDAQALGIETRTPEQLKQMKSDWKE